MKKILFFLLFISFGVLAKDYNFVVKSGDNLGKYFQKAKLSQSLLINLINSSQQTKKLNNLKIGKKLTITTKNNKFKKLVYFYNSNYKLVVELYGKSFISNIVKTNSKLKKLKKHQFTINKSLFYDGKKSGLSFNQIEKINTELNKYINTNKLQKKDKVQVFFSGEDLIAIKYFGKKNIELFKWGNVFYTKNGLIFYNMFLSSPLKYKRISSGFSYSRFHPVLKVYRPHRAIDYAAPKGEKVKATASGVVVKKGYYGALGNMVQIKHKYNYYTVYAHLSKFANIKKGQKIKQGQVIGYVGSTGRSTGNHLHYELRHGKDKSKKYFNPLKYNPKLRFYLKGSELKEFKKYIKQFK